MIGFEGQAAIVTGAGRGLGREVALGLARRGCSVLVNDYGGGTSALKPGSIDVAQGVVDEILAAGGQAIADGSDIAAPGAAAAIVARAKAAFGRVDILVNNAGGNISSPVDGLEDAQVEGIVAVNFTGGYRLLRRVWPIMKAQGHGRIVNILSSTLLGMDGKAAYAAGKAGLMTLGFTAAVEGRAHGINVNGILPVVNSRLSGGLPPGPLQDWMGQFDFPPVAEAVIYFCAKECAVTGEMFSAGAGRVARNAIYNAEGYYDAGLTADMLAAHIDEARDMGSAQLVADTAAENARYFGIAPWPGA